MPDGTTIDAAANFAQTIPYPDSFWIASIVLGVLMAEAFFRLRTPWAKPALAIYLTIGAWYLYNMVYDTPAHFFTIFTPDLIDESLYQVVLFLVTFRLSVGGIAKTFAKGLVDYKGYPHYDPGQLMTLFKWIAGIWALLFAIGVSQIDFNILSIIWPPTSEFKIHMFGRAAIGKNFDFLLSFAGYVYLLVCALFGVMLAVGDLRLKVLTGAMIALTWPYFFFDRTRNAMLAVLLPGVVAYWLLTSGKLARKVVFSVILFTALNSWFLIVMKAREHGGVYMEAYTEQGQDLSEVKHEGLNMLEELCWIDQFIQNGRLVVSPGARYFGEFVNFVPRSIWPDKPRVGYDYAIARGLQDLKADGEVVLATVSTGMIGQGVHNFGPFLGVIAAALIMACWAGFLGRLWMQRDQLPRAALFMVGIGLTFNMGRDITLLVLWPFVFGYIGVRLYEARQKGEKQPTRKREGAERRAPGSRNAI